MYSGFRGGGVSGRRALRSLYICRGLVVESVQGVEYGEGVRRLDNICYPMLSPHMNPNPKS